MGDRKLWADTKHVFRGGESVREHESAWLASEAQDALEEIAKKAEAHGWTALASRLRLLKRGVARAYEAQAEGKR